MELLELPGSIAVDKEGYLRRLDDWDDEVAVVIARREGIHLVQSHWEIIRLLRSFYKRHQVSPANRALVKLVERELGSDKGRSVYLMKLFGGSPTRLACKIAGLPKPENCL